jgi:tetratricopeptide (TPR) repeat protein
MKERDETPSAIYGIERQIDPLPPPNQRRDSYIPVLPVSRSVVIWQKIRWPLWIASALVCLAIVVTLVLSILATRAIEKAVFGAQLNEAKGTLEGIGASGMGLEELSRQHGDRDSVLTALAWQRVVTVLLFGSNPELVQDAKNFLNRCDDDVDQTGEAARAGLLTLAGDHQKAIDQSRRGLREAPGNPRFEMVRIHALHGIGKFTEALKIVDEALGESPRYAPLVVIGLSIALDMENHDAALNLQKKLIQISSDENLFSSLATLILLLPRWNLSPERSPGTKILAQHFVALSARLKSPPPKLAALKHYLKGRIHLAAGNPEDAVISLETAVSGALTPTRFAWQGAALYRAKGAQATLELLETKPNISCPEILEMRARCLLEFHRVDLAFPIVKRLEESGALTEQAANLKWILAVRSGDISKALQLTPTVIQDSQINVALELHRQLADIGDRQGIIKIADSLGESRQRCANAIKDWQSRRIHRALNKLDYKSDDICIKTLVGKLMRGHMEPARLNRSVLRPKPGVHRDLFNELDRALITWHMEGHAAASSILENIWESRPSGAPLRTELARAFLEMDLPERVFEVLKDLETPAALELKYSGSQALGDRDENKYYLAAKQKKTDSVSHPALDYIVIRAAYLKGDYEEVSRAAKEILPEGGRWSASIAEMGAKAINLVGDRSAADRLLKKASEKIGAVAGMDQYWNARLALVRMNMRRGGKFARRAIVWLGDMKRDDIRDARISFGLAMAKIRSGDEKSGLALMDDALTLDPSFRPAYVQLKKMELLDEKHNATIARIWPGWSP